MSSTKFCVLHLGLHKTGTTSIQKTIQKNIHLFSQNKWHYPIFQIDKKRYANHSIPIMTLYGDNPENHQHYRKIRRKIDLDFIKKSLSEQLDISLSASSNLIISGEGISRLPIKNIEVFIESLLQNDFTVIPIIFVRPPYSSLCSNLQQVIKGLNYVDLIDPDFILHSKVLESKTPLRRDLDTLNNLLTLFGHDLQIHNFNNAISHKNGLFCYFLENLPFNFTDDIIEVKSNISQTNKWVRLQNLINYSQSSREYNTRIMLELNLKFKDDSKFLLTSDEYKIIESKLERYRDKISLLIGDQYINESIRHSSIFTSADWVDVIKTMSEFNHLKSMVSRSTMRSVYQ